MPLPKVAVRERSSHPIGVDRLFLNPERRAKPSIAPVHCDTEGRWITVV
jgi:hypothetical protein